MKRHSQHSETKAVHGAADLEKKNGPLSTPIYQTSTFQVTDNDEQVRIRDTDHHYTRYGNPTNTVAETTIAELEGMDAALTFASGMGAVTRGRARVAQLSGRASPPAGAVGRSGRTDLYRRPHRGGKA